MKKMHNKGFSTVETIMALVIVVLIGLIGWYVWKSKNNENEATSIKAVVVKTTNTDAVELNKTYTNPYGKFTVDYPSTWKLNQESQPGYGMDASLTSPEGTVLHVSANEGGKGGMCEPPDNEKPFEKGNSCPSQEFLSKEKLDIDNVYGYVYGPGVNDPPLSKIGIYLVTKKFAGTDGIPSYTIGVTDDNFKDSLKLNDPVMGLVSDSEFFTNYTSKGEFRPYIYVYAAGASKAFLSSSDANTIKAIARTLKINN